MGPLVWGPIGWIESAVEKYLVLLQIAAEIAAEIDIADVGEVGPLGHQQRVRIRPRSLELLRLEISVDGAVVGIAPRLGHDVDHATQRGSGLRLTTSGLD